MFTSKNFIYWVKKKFFKIWNPIRKYLYSHYLFCFQCSSPISILFTLFHHRFQVCRYIFFKTTEASYFSWTFLVYFSCHAFLNIIRRKFWRWEYKILPVFHSHNKMLQPQFPYDYKLEKMLLLIHSSLDDSVFSLVKSCSTEYLFRVL